MSKSTNGKRTVGQPFLVKLLLVFLLTGILILSVVAGYLIFASGSAQPPHHFLHKGLAKCTTSLAAEIGVPPKLEHAQELADELGLGIRVTTSDGAVWESSGDKFGRMPVYMVQSQGVTYEFHVQETPSANRYLLREVLAILALLIVILCISFFVIRWMLRPLKKLVAGVEAIAEGQLDYRISMRPGDEFESIGNAFDQMTSKIRQMISAREQLLSDLSHELRSPLTRLRLSSEFIEKPELRMSFAEDVKEMEEMISNVLEAARLSSAYGEIEKSPVDLNIIVKDLVKKYETQAPGVVFTAEETPRMIQGHQVHLKSAIRNIIENALKYSSEQSQPVEIKLEPEGLGVLLSVKDYGIGIPKEEQALIFEAFYRVDKSRTRTTGGFGLGLNLCQKIVEAHGGEMRVESELGAGSTFSIWLPLG